MLERITRCFPVAKSINSQQIILQSLSIHSSRFSREPPTIYICNHRNTHSVFFDIYSPHDIYCNKIEHAPPEWVDHLGFHHHRPPFHPPFLQCPPLLPRVDCRRRLLLSRALLLLLSYSLFLSFKMRVGVQASSKMEDSHFFSTLTTDDFARQKTNEFLRTLNCCSILLLCFLHLPIYRP